MKKNYIKPELAVENVKNEEMLIVVSPGTPADPEKPVLAPERKGTEETYGNLW